MKNMLCELSPDFPSPFASWFAHLVCGLVQELASRALHRLQSALPPHSPSQLPSTAASAAGALPPHPPAAALQSAAGQPGGVVYPSPLLHPPLLPPSPSPPPVPQQNSGVQQLWSQPLWSDGEASKAGAAAADPSLASQLTSRLPLPSQSQAQAHAQTLAGAQEGAASERLRVEHQLMLSVSVRATLRPGAVCVALRCTSVWGPHCGACAGVSPCNSVTLQQASTA